MLQAELCQRHDVGLVHPAHDHGVDLHRTQPGRVGRDEAGEHVVESVAPGKGGVPLPVERIQGDVDPVQPGGSKLGHPLVKADPVGRQGQFGGETLVRTQCRSAGDDAGKATPQQRFATGEPDLAHAQHPDGHPDHPHDLVVGEHLRGGEPGQAIGRHAVRAPQVAPVGQRHPQVARHPPVGVGEPFQRGHYGGHKRLPVRVGRTSLAFRPPP